MRNPHIHHTPQSHPPLPGLTPAVRGQWQAIGNAGVACQVLGWTLCRYVSGEQGSSYGIILSVLGICAFLIEFYGRLRYRKKQLPFPQGYSLCRYSGFAAAVAAVFVQYMLGDGPSAILLLSGGLMLFWVSLNLEKHQRRRLRAQQEMEEN